MLYPGALTLHAHITLSIEMGLEIINLIVLKNKPN